MGNKVYVGIGFEHQGNYGTYFALRIDPEKIEGAPITSDNYQNYDLMMTLTKDGSRYSIWYDEDRVEKNVPRKNPYEKGTAAHAIHETFVEDAPDENGLFPSNQNESEVVD
jgi:hypothetical protein